MRAVLCRDPVGSGFTHDNHAGVDDSGVIARTDSDPVEQAPNRSGRTQYRTTGP
jgi:hypothetical protein